MTEFIFDNDAVSSKALKVKVYLIQVLIMSIVCSGNDVSLIMNVVRNYYVYSCIAMWLYVNDAL